MCGICGIIRFDDQPVEPGRIEKSCEALRHRGPDWVHTWIDNESNNTVGIGATRLAVLDPSPRAHQPMHQGEGRYHLVFNGEIYNFPEIRRLLIEVGETFQSQGDTEVLLAACARWGVDALSRLNGMWALAFYDSRLHEGFLARDRFGIKPLLYRTTDRGLCFASELRALTLLDDFDRQIDPHSLVQHLQFGYIVHPATIYRHVYRLAPGHVLMFTASSAQSTQRYYTLPGNHSDEAKDYGAACSMVRRRLGEAVVRRRVSDVPIGVFLSGGLDSSIIVYHLASVTASPVQTFSVGYAGQKTYDETSYARIVAQRFGTEHRDIMLTQDDVIREIPRILDHLGEPVGDSSIVPTTLISQFAAQYVTVALSGDGGDELFGGYWRYLGHDTLAAYQSIPAVFRRLVIEPLLSRAGVSRSSVPANRIRQFQKLLRASNGDPLARHIAWSSILSPEAESLFQDRDRPVNGTARMLESARALTEDAGSDDPLYRILAFDLQYSLPGDMLHKVDLAGMMHSLEVRVPFLDHELVEAAMTLPSSFKIDRGLRKRILVDTYRGYLPDEVLDRSKQGFEVPIGEYFRGPLREMFLDTVTREAVESFGLLSYPAVEAIYRDHLARRADHADLLFALLSLCWWQRRMD